ncbi:hypothetical protein GCM10020369_04660 [Cryptosporangium minutisporangium]|uniref:Uncharacterized protein n=1 Tax=Cryptosporangium minutisporangium TaxID=113569 RepID=A0ABP6SPY7_9ACTN
MLDRLPGTERTALLDPGGDPLDGVPQRGLGGTERVRGEGEHTAGPRRVQCRRGLTGERAAERCRGRGVEVDRALAVEADRRDRLQRDPRRGRVDREHPGPVLGTGDDEQHVGVPGVGHVALHAIDPSVRRGARPPAAGRGAAVRLGETERVPALTGQQHP